MCGIAGFLQPTPEAESVLRAMTQAIAHRGPDAEGHWLDREAGIALGHRRLSILDLTSAGAQPMQARSGRYVLSFNGEIYNFRPLQDELKKRGHRFRGHSDTEVLLASVEQWGVDDALNRIHGMFAFALWDRHTRQLTLARDRVGKKPLYYGWSGDALLFGSELKALRAHPGFDARIDRGALEQYLRYGWVPEPRSIYTSVRKLSPGQCIHIRTGDPAWAAQPKTWWRANEACRQARSTPFKGTFQQAEEQLDGLLRKATSERMVADVELGALLSGGIDSTLVVALMQQLSDQPARSFSIGFDEEKYNEAEHAQAIARHLGTRHQELYVRPQDSLDLVETLPQVYDEPFADVSQLPTLLVSRMARQAVTVVLSGDGGDESFGGYNHYFEALAQWRRMSRFSPALRRRMRVVIEALAQWNWQWMEGRARTGKRLAGWRRFGARWEKRSRGWAATSPPELLLQRFARHPNPGALVIGGHPTPVDLEDPRHWIEGVDPLLALRLTDYIGYLPGDILVKVDRASMSTGLEVRSPLLDTRIARFAWSLPTDFLVDGRGGKRILRSLMARYVPPRLSDRPKRGFGVPVGRWLKGPLQEWARDLLDPALLERQGFLNADEVQTVWHQHQSGWRNHDNLLWALLMFQSWFQAEAGTRATANK